MRVSKVLLLETEIMIFTPEKNLYRKYGDPYRVAEFRIFSFNNCGAGCKNCFYLKSNNNYYDFKKVRELAESLKNNGYTLESCYILPTDVFENEFNYKVFEDKDFRSAIGLFNYVGLATTLRNGFVARVFDDLLELNNQSLRIELHVNLREDQLTNKNYVQDLSFQLSKIKKEYGDRVLINLALNLGSRLSDEDHRVLKELVFNFSDDKILEMNFTFLFNPNIPKRLQIQYLKDSYPTMQFFTKEYGMVENSYNRRTLMRKPSFVFKDNKIFLTPIIPFDEFVFLDEDYCVLKEADFESFLEAYQRIEARNVPILPECDGCNNLEYCMGKSFFTIAHSLQLPCIKEAV